MTDTVPSEPVEVSHKAYAEYLQWGGFAATAWQTLFTEYQAKLAAGLIPAADRLNEATRLLGRNYDYLAERVIEWGKNAEAANGPGAIAYAQSLREDYLARAIALLTDTGTAAEKLAQDSAKVNAKLVYLAPQIATHIGSAFDWLQVIDAVANGDLPGVHANLAQMVATEAAGALFFAAGVVLAPTLPLFAVAVLAGAMAGLVGFAGSDAGWGFYGDFGRWLEPYARDGLLGELGGALGRGLFDITDLISATLRDRPDPFYKHPKFFPRVDPLVLDLNGDGLHITPLSRTPAVMFDADGDLIKTATAWISANDGLLVLDLNGNGQIDNGGELFGDQTVLTSGVDAGKKADDGFAALADLDSDHDGLFNASDARFGAVRIWTDLNQDGINQAGELKSLSESGVVSISLASSAAGIDYGDALLVQQGSFTRTDGSTGQAASFLFAQDDAVHEFVPITVSAEAQTLPAIAGAGWARNLQEAATQNPALVGLVNQAQSATTKAAFREAVSNLLLQWGTDAQYTSASEDALSHGYGVINSEPRDAQEESWMDVAVKGSVAERNAFRAGLSEGDLTKFDAMRERMVGRIEKIYAYEALLGVTFMKWDYLQDDAFFDHSRYTLPDGRGEVRFVDRLLSVAFFEERHAVASAHAGYIVYVPTSDTTHAYELWSILVDDAVKNLTPILQLDRYVDEIDLSVSDTGVSLDFAALNASLANATAVSAYEGTSTLLDMHKTYGTGLNAAGWNGDEQLLAQAQLALTDSEVNRAFTEAGYNALGAGSSVGSAGVDVFVGDTAANTFNGGAGDDVIGGQAGNDILSGGIGDDDVYGDAGIDALYGGDGNDMLDGGLDNDALYGEGGDDDLRGGPGNDSISGSAGNDILDGGTGNDNLYSGAGNNVFVFGKGDGQDRVGFSYNNNAPKPFNTLQFEAGVLPSEVQLRQATDVTFGGVTALEFAIAGTADKITFDGFFYNNDPTDGRNSLQQVTFSEGTSWNLAAILDKLYAGSDGVDNLTGTIGANTISGQAGADVLYGRDGSDTLDGGADGDTLYGENGNDSLLGGGGSDTLDGGAGDDTLDGGLGNDVLACGAGSNVFLFGKGDGQDRVGFSYDASVGRLNSLQFKAGVLPSEVQLRQATDVTYGGTSALELSIAGTADKITFDGFFYQDNPADGRNSLQQVTFSDGTTWNLTTILSKLYAGTANAETLVGTLGADTINGLAGADTLAGRGGNDVLDGGADNDALYGEGGDDSLLGGTGNDIVDGGIGNDTLDGGLGNDTLYCGAGNNVFKFGKGDGQDRVGFSYDASVGRLNSLQFKAGVLPSEVQLRQATDVTYGGTSALELSIAGTADKITFDGFFYQDNPADGRNSLQQVTFSDGTTWNLTTILSKLYAGTANAETLVGTLGADTINGLAGADTLAGRGGNDVLDGGADNDALYGEGGDDSLLGGTGNDIVDGGIGNDTLDGGLGNDTLYCGAGNNVFKFGKGDGQDRVGFSYDATVGKLNNLQFKAGVLPSEVQLRQATDVTYGGITALEFSISGTTDKITFDGFFYQDNPADGRNSLQQVTFSDGTTWNLTTILSKLYAGTANAETLVGTLGADTINGLAGADTLAGRGGNDVLDGGADNDAMYGEGGDDSLLGGTGNDIVDGGIGNDTLDGGLGNDTLAGGTGNDTFVLGRDYGADTIQDNDATAGNTDVLQFLSGIATNQVWFRHVGNNLEVSIIGTTDKAILSNWYLGAIYHLEKFQTADGKVLTDASVEALVTAMASFAPPAIGEVALVGSYLTTLSPVIDANWL